MEPTGTGDGADPAWTIAVDGGPRAGRVAETLLTLADGRFGTRGVREEDGAAATPPTLAAGVYDGAEVPALLPAPVWTGLQVTSPDHHDRRRLDLRTGVLHREWAAGGATLRSLRFASLARPGVAGLRAEGPAAALAAGPALLPPGGVDPACWRQGRIGDAAWASTVARGGGGITAAAGQRESGGPSPVVERLAVHLADPHRVPAPEAAVAALRAAEAVGFERLLAEHRAAWAARWADAEVAIRGDPDAELAVRFALFHLLATAAGGGGEAAVGARGLSGPVYLGHVFWDSDVFVLPVLAAVHPAAARAMLEYRVRRLPAARRLAAASGRAGARFPWESAADGGEVTPKTMLDPLGRVMEIHTGELEEHIVADVPWAACRYADWTGDAAFLHGSGRDLLVETARYWASRPRLDAGGRAHIDGVIGPDEYHVGVDDNAFTNAMARWNLRRAAALVEEAGDPDQEARAWRRLAGAIVDGYDPASGRHQQFAGFDELEPLLIGELARPPVAADLLLGRERVAATQIVKQADVLMLHLLVPEEAAPGSLAPDLAWYGPRTAHGSSLSPAVHAALLARAGRPDQALELFRLAARLDLDDVTGTTAGGLHVATFGGVWQALAQGFLGLRPSGGALGVDPRLPAAWEAVTLRLRFHDRRVRVAAGHDRLDLEVDGPVRVEVAGLPAGTVAPPGASWHRVGPAWAPA